MKKRMAAVRAAKATPLEAPICEELRARLDDESEEGVWVPGFGVPQSTTLGRTINTASKVYERLSLLL
jgi:hypothetical protein